jgi:hypothetical protein
MPYLNIFDIKYINSIRYLNTDKEVVGSVPGTSEYSFVFPNELILERIPTAIRGHLGIYLVEK